MNDIERVVPPGALAASAIQRGDCSPIGATVVGSGVNFSVFSRHATAVELWLFDSADDARPSRVIKLEPGSHRTYHYWHVLVPGVRAGQVYGFKVDGPFDPATGMRFDASKLLLDPYGRAVAVPAEFQRNAGAKAGDNTAVAMKSVVVDPSRYDWEGDQPLRRPSSQTIVYEVHVRGFTRHPNSGVTGNRRGTYAGLIEKIPYLQELGISAVELLPVFQFDAQDCPLGDGRTNYWGYQPVSFFAPHQSYSSRPDPLGAVDEFRDMVKAMHKAGIEVILDVVYNHTSEGGKDGPTFCFKGLDNSMYYILDEGTSSYANFSGTGNTLNANHPIVRRMIVDSLRYWVQEMHVDGFRFDLASILSRGRDGQPIPNPPVLWDIESDPVLAGTKLIAEAWDAAGLYQVGTFFGDSWKEWNGRFRDDVRDFFRGAPGSVRRFADRLIGSPEIYSHKRREAEQSINFVTCHDGFTLNDLCSYDRKHNEANGEFNKDGTDDNRSWNCGVEGPTDDPTIERLRTRQVKNFLTVTMLSLGVPMILMGDEVRRTQGGNNNAYCHDSEATWFDWSLPQKHAGLLRFVSLLNERRLLRNAEVERQRVTLEDLLRDATFAWHGVKLGEPDWGDSSHSIALSVQLSREHVKLYIAFNAFHQALEFELPRQEGGSSWRRWIDTALESPFDITPWSEAVEIDQEHCRVESHSIQVFVASSEAGVFPLGERRSE